MIEWEILDRSEQFHHLLQQVHTPVIIFKHSPRCGLSAMVKSQFEDEWPVEEEKQTALYLLDVVRHRALSQRVAEQLDVEHQSPQALIIYDGSCIFDTSHRSITSDRLLTELKKFRIET